MSVGEARCRALEPLAQIEAQVIVGVNPTIRLPGLFQRPSSCSRGLGCSWVIVTCSRYEAFASVVLAWFREYNVDPEKVYRNAVPSHSAIRSEPREGSLITMAVHDLARTGGRTAFVVMFTGGGLATGTVLVRD